MLRGDAAEKTHYAPLVAGGLDGGWSLYRIEDGGYGRKPCDIGGLSAAGLGVILEVKLVERQPRQESLPWKKFEAHQVAWLFRAWNVGAMPLVALYAWEEERMVLYHVRGKDTPARVLPSVELVLRHSEKGDPIWGLLSDWHLLERVRGNVIG